MKIKLFIALILCVIGQITAQSKSTKPSEELLVVQDSVVINKKAFNPLSPSKAAFYSAVLPGLGQAYNKKFWKIPIVYAALGTGIYFYITNNNEYNDVRDAYKRRLAGFQDDRFLNTLPNNEQLLEAQKTLRRNKELSLLITFGIYALNIIDANVDAHLMQFNVNDDLSFKPHYQIEEFDNKGRFGLTLNYQF